MKTHRVTVYGHKQIKVFEETIEVAARNADEASEKAVRLAEEKLGDTSGVVFFKTRSNR